MYSLYQTALSLCSVKRLNELIDALLPHCITAMDVATACLLSRNDALHIMGSELRDVDEEYLRKQFWRASDQCIHSKLPSGRSLLAASIVQENRYLGTLIVVDKEASDFEEEDFKRMNNLATITATALGNVYEYEDLIQRAEDLEEDLKKREELELQRLRQEFENARLTQLSLLPRQSPRLEGFEIEGVCLPAQEVGGDFYDYVPLDDDTLALVLADVSGKGLKGAMYAVLSYGILHAEAKFGVLPSQMLWILNEDLRARIRELMNCAMCIATIDLNHNILRYSNAGIPYPIVKRGSEVFELKANGVPLGMLRNSEYEDIELELQPGDIVVFLSDGITECLSKNDPEQFYWETERLFSVISGLEGKMSPQAMIHSILADLRDFSGGSPQSDDITIIVVKVKESNLG
jgi:serine phosphatase RsbU (regulator of sigma subunit)